MGLPGIGLPTKFRPLMPSHFRTLAALCCLLGACAPEIGDDCSTSADCATTDQSRLCLSEALESFPGGYCTVFNCQPGSCPSESVCVGYRTALANAPECQDPSARARLQQTYCMRTCSKDGDCRTGYACIDMGEENPWGASVLEEGKRASRTKICAVPYSEPEDAPDRSADVCSWQLPSGDTGAVSTPDAGSGPRPVVSDAAAPSGSGVMDASPADAAGPATDAAASLADGGPSGVGDGGETAPLDMSDASSNGMSGADAASSAQLGDAAADAAP